FMKKQYKPFLLLLLIMLLAGCSSLKQIASTPLKANHWYDVASIVDGDTLLVKTGSQQVVVKLLSIDAPSLSSRSGLDSEPYAEESAAYAKQLLEEPRQARLTFDKEIYNSQGHPEAIVVLRDGRILNELLLQEGLAKVLIIEPNVKM